MDNFKINYTNEFTVNKILSDPVTVREWGICGLPADELSIENAIFVSLLYVPGMHGRQYARPLSACTYPAGHPLHVSSASQAPTASENRPAAHATHEVLLVCPTASGPYLPGGQFWQRDSWATPTLSDHRPSGHPLQASAAPDAPSANSCSPSSSENRPTTQSSHPTEALGAAATGPNMPRGQASQSMRG